jgi:PmbA/TldA metallopeptidase C-terminal domain
MMIKLKIKNYMKIFNLLLISILCLNFSAEADSASDESIFRAMKDEIARSMSGLKIDGLEKPYFIEYHLEILSPYSLEASLGSVVSESANKMARLSVGVKVGDYDFDNTNFFDVGLNFFGSSDDEQRFKKRAVSFEPDYDYLRRELWLATDAAFKQSAELYSKKIAALKNKIRRDTTPDFLHSEPSQHSFIKEIPKLDTVKFRRLLKKMSSVFTKYPEISASAVALEFIPRRVYYMNSEGTSFRSDDYYTGLEVVASTKTEDGMPLGDYYTAFSHDPENLPAGGQMLFLTKRLAKSLSFSYQSDAIEDDYNGPVLFYGNAAAEILAQHFIPNLVAQRKPVSEGGFSAGNNTLAFQRKIGGRVLPDFLTVSALPNLKKFRNTELLGNYEIDGDGLVPDSVLLVENGYLKNLLSSRIPTKKVMNSNAHKREGAAMVSTIQINSSGNNVSRDSLKKRLIEICKERDLEYGIIVDRIINPNVFATTMYKSNPGLFPFMDSKASFMPTRLIKIYTDGREEFTRGLIGKNVNARTFRDIILTSDESLAYNYLGRAVISPFISGGAQYIGSTVITPEFLLEDFELILYEKDFTRTQIVENPITKHK